MEKKKRGKEKLEVGRLFKEGRGKKRGKKKIEMGKNFKEGGKKGKGGEKWYKQKVKKKRKT